MMVREQVGEMTTSSFQWRSVRYAATHFNRTQRLIRYWCVRGEFQKRGIPTYQDRSKRWWIALTSRKPAL